MENTTISLILIYYVLGGINQPYGSEAAMFLGEAFFGINSVVVAVANFTVTWEQSWWCCIHSSCSAPPTGQTSYWPVRRSAVAAVIAIVHTTIMAENETLEYITEHERILQEIESTDTACVGPTLR